MARRFARFRSSLAVAPYQLRCVPYGPGEIGESCHAWTLYRHKGPRIQFGANRIDIETLIVLPTFSPLAAIRAGLPANRHVARLMANTPPTMRHRIEGDLMCAQRSFPFLGKEQRTAISKFD